MISARSVHVMAEAENEVNQLLYERHQIAPGNEADFEVHNTTEIADMLGIIGMQIQDATVLLPAVARLVASMDDEDMEQYRNGTHG